jgi:hypothetical protein
MRSGWPTAPGCGTGPTAARGRLRHGTGYGMGTDALSKVDVFGAAAA